MGICGSRHRKKEADDPNPSDIGEEDKNSDEEIDLEDDDEDEEESDSPPPAPKNISGQLQNKIPIQNQNSSVQNSVPLALTRSKIQNPATIQITTPIQNPPPIQNTAVIQSQTQIQNQAPIQKQTLQKKALVKLPTPQQQKQNQAQVPAQTKVTKIVTGKQQPTKPRPPISTQAQSILLALPGANQSTFLSTFYKARELTPLDKAYPDIITYVKNGQVHNYKLKVNKILRIVRNGDVEFEHDAQLKKRFRMMLWHGTKLAKVAPILQNGFQLPTPTGQMFGPGIYFADRVSKSCNYTDSTTHGSKAYLFLCDVLLGNMYNAKGAHNQFTQAPSGFQKNFDSVMCTGQYVPERTENASSKGSIIPCGTTVSNTKFTSYTVQYNEYIVYDTSKIKIKYLVQVEFC